MMLPVCQALPGGPQLHASSPWAEGHPGLPGDGTWGWLAGAQGQPRKEPLPYSPAAHTPGRTRQSGGSGQALQRSHADRRVIRTCGFAQRYVCVQAACLDRSVTGRGQAGQEAEQGDRFPSVAGGGPAPQSCSVPVGLKFPPTHSGSHSCFRVAAEARPLEQLACADGGLLSGGWGAEAGTWV